MKINMPPPLRRPGGPIHAHRLDPDVVHQRAHELGEAAADAGGALDDATIAGLIDVLLQAAKVQGYAGNIDGLRIRLIWTIRDAAAGRDRARAWTERQVRRAAISAITRGLPHHSVLHAAKQANEVVELPMPEADIENVVATEIAIEARRRECMCCRCARPGHD